MAFAPIDAFADAAPWAVTGGELDVTEVPGPRTDAGAVRLVAEAGASGARAADGFHR